MRYICERESLLLNEGVDVILRTVGKVEQAVSRRILSQLCLCS